MDEARTHVEHELPEEIYKALNTMSQEDLDTFNQRLEGFRHPLQHAVASMGYMLPSETADKARALLGGAGMFCSMIGLDHFSAAFALICSVSHKNPLILLLPTRLIRSEDGVVVETNAPPLEELRKTGALVEGGSPEAVDMLRKIGILPPEDEDGEDRPPAPPTPSVH